MQQEIRLSQRIKYSFVAAGGTLIMLALVNVWVTQQRVLERTFDSELITQAGRQAALSQQLVKDALLLQVLTDVSTRQRQADQMKRHLASCESEYNGLRYRSQAMGKTGRILPGKNTLAVDSLFKQSQSAHQAMVQAVQALLQGNALAENAQRAATMQTALATLLTQEATLMADWERIAEQYRDEANTKLNSLESLLWQTTYITVAVVIILGLTLIRPLQKIIDQFIHRQAQQIDQLHAVQANLMRVNTFQNVILDSALLSIITTDKKGLITYVNPTASQWLGYLPEELIGQHTPAIIHSSEEVEARIEKFSQESQQAIGTDFESLIGQACKEKSEMREWTYVRKDGTHFPVLLTVSAMCDEEGSSAGFIGVAIDISPWKEAEAQLRASESLYRLLSDTTRDIISLHHPDGSYAFLSASVQEVLGYTPQEMLGQSLLEFIHPEDLPDVQRAYRHSFVGSQEAIQFRMRRKDGSFVWLETRVKLIFDAQQNLMHIQASSRDISARKQMESKLRQSEQNLLEAQRITRTGSWEYETATGLITWSENTFAVYGFPVAPTAPSLEVLSKRLHPDDRPTMLAYVASATRGLPYENDTRLVLPDGDIRWIHTIARVQKDEQGNVVKLYGTVSDVTERKNREAELKRVSSLLQSVMDSSLSGIMAFRSVRDNQSTLIDFVWLMVNRAAETLTSRQASDLIGKRLLEEMPGNGADGLFDQYVQVVETGVPLNIEHYYCHEGLQTWYHIVAVPLEDGLAVTFADITVQRAAENQLQQAYQELQTSEERLRSHGEEMQTVNEMMEDTIGTLRTTQLHLVQAEKMASLGQLTAGIAHEINNPINFVYAGVSNMKQSLRELYGVMTHYEALEKALSAEEQAQQRAIIAEAKQTLYYEENKENIWQTLHSIENGAARTAEIVKGLRLFSRLDEAEYTYANLHDNLESTLVLLGNKLKNRITVTRHYDDTLPNVECYSGQLNQVFMNLFTNAIQAIDGSGEITIRTQNHPDTISISIQDSGAGMSLEVQRHIFEPFFTTKKVGEGTGLGLSISYGIIQKHRGEIGVTSEEGKGTTFFIKLPKQFCPDV